MTGRWSDLIDMAAKSAGLPYPSFAEIEHVLWEQTCYPMGTSEEVWRQALAYFQGQAAPYPGPPCPSAASAVGVTEGSTGARRAES